jgi:signal transduction histidine kinase
VPDRLATILNVNDHEPTRYMITRILRGSGFHVLEAGTGEDALRLAGADPDLIVLDVKLPDVSGFEVCRLLKQNTGTASIAILQTSATFVTTEKKVQGLDAGADGYLTHPFEPAELIATVKALLRMRRAEQELRRRADALVQADHRKDEFLAMLAHELRNPLAAMSMAIPMIAAAKRDEGKLDKLCAVLTRQTQHLSRLIDDLLDVARITQGKITLRRAPTAVAQVLQDAIQTNSGTTARRRQAVVVSISAEPMFVMGDASRIEQVFCNLIENASKYSDEGTRIQVTLGRQQRDGIDFALVRVADEGIGISASVLPHVFDLFVQADESLERSRGGMGIGLTLVKSIVGMHDGHVLASSPGVGRGSVFEVWLPLTAERPEPLDAARRQPAASRRRSVLIIEDNEDARETLRMFLEAEGHVVEVAADGPSGLDMALAGRHELAFVDVGLPGLDGYQVAQRIRAHRGAHAIRLVALTGYGGDEQRSRALRAGFDAHMVKPPNPEALLRIVEDVPAREDASSSGDGEASASAG